MITRDDDGAGTAPAPENLRSFDRAAAFFFLEADGHVGIRRQANGAILDLGDEAQRDEMVVAFVLALTAVVLCQFDATFLYAVDGPDMAGCSARLLDAVEVALRAR